jgi:hypothetical protein
LRTGSVPEANRRNVINPDQDIQDTVSDGRQGIVLNGTHRKYGQHFKGNFLRTSTLNTTPTFNDFKKAMKH